MSWYQQAAPRSWLVPDLVATVTAAPPAMPCSASKDDVEMLTVSMDSTGGLYRVWWGSQMYTLMAPSTRVLLLLRLVPLTLVVSERWGEAPIEFWKAAGVAPGTRLMRLW